ncbi:hypothetical protein MPSEU_000976300 [Mayamaea pseudoterrestris]|nr:hypothetical protein MPSEU_000976300 [Mayamaea pseudoterrestris]
MNPDESSQYYPSLTNMMAIHQDDQLQERRVDVVKLKRPSLVKDQIDGNLSNRSIFIKLSRSTSPERSLRPMATLVHALTSHFPMPSKTGIRSPFKHVSTPATNPRARDAPSVNDDKDDESFSLDQSHFDESDSNYDDVIEELVGKLGSTTTTTMQEGKLIRRRRSKQLSKGRRNNRKVRTMETKLNASDGSWDKFVKLAESQHFEAKEMEDSTSI